jgi:hypothetical protein
MQDKREGLLWVIIVILMAIIIKQQHGKTINRWRQAYQQRHKQKRKWRSSVAKRGKIQSGVKGPFLLSKSIEQGRVGGVEG